MDHGLFLFLPIVNFHLVFGWEDSLGIFTFLHLLRCLSLPPLAHHQSV